MGRRAAEVDPKDADVRHFIARTLLNYYGEKPEAVDEAVTQLDEGLRLRPADLVPLWDFAATFFERPKAPAAVERLHATLARYADRPDSHFPVEELREALRLRANYPEARELLEKLESPATMNCPPSPSMVGTPPYSKFLLSSTRLALP